MSHSASRVARTNRDQVAVVPTAPPLIPSSSQTPLPSLPPSGLIYPRTHRRQAAAAGKPTATVDYGFVRLHPTPPTVPRLAPTARKPRPPRTTSPSEVSPRPSIDPVLTVPIPPATDAANTFPALAWCTPSRCSSACQHSSCTSRDTVTGRNQVHLLSGTRTQIGHAHNALNRSELWPFGIFFLAVPRSSPTISSFTWRLANASRCPKCAL